MASFASIHVCSANSTVVTWSVVSLDPSQNFGELFSSVQAGKYAVVKASPELSAATLESVYVGKDIKSSMSIVQRELNAVDVCNNFGSYIKFIVSIDQPGVTFTRNDIHVAKNAFEIMMQSQRRISAPSLPDPIVERTKKDKLFNDLLQLIAQRGLKFAPSQHESGKSYLATVTSALWYVDGHEASLSSRGCEIPELFKAFKGYNSPELSKHRKREHVNLNTDKLAAHVASLYDNLLLSWLNTTEWQSFREATEKLACALDSYLSYMRVQNKRMKVHHDSSATLVADKTAVQLIPANPTPSCCLAKLNDAVAHKDPYEHIFVSDFSPSKRREKYRYVQELRKGLSRPCVLCTCSIGGPVGNYLFVWPLQSHITLEAALHENQKVISKIQADVPTYHNRALRKKLVSNFGRISPKTSLASLREMYRMATGDQTASLTTAENELDERLRQSLEMEDLDLIVDLRQLNKGHRDTFVVFWEKMKIYLNESSAVHERRHGEVTYMANAISVRDLVQEVAKMCPGEPVPSEQWVRLQFCPKNPRSKTASQYKSQFNVKMMVQKRQFRHDHVDAHYCAALFRYMREFAILFRNLSMFVSLDDKHRIKVGEPNYPVAAAERGRRVLVAENKTFEVGDHDFTRFSIIPSVSFVITIPETIEGSFYEGKVHVGYKDAVFQPSSALRHATKLHSILIPRIGNKSILFVYTDGGPDHRLTFFSVQLSLVALFLNLDLDLLVVGRTAPNHSWRNPVERIMSVLNLGLQCVGMMRKEGSPEFEKAIKNANSINAVREAAKEQFKHEVKASLQPPLKLLGDITSRLELKKEPFSVVESASDDQIEAFWEIIHCVDDTVDMSESSKSTLQKKQKLKAFFDHCCQIRHYSFCVKKCGVTECNICKPVRMDIDQFKNIHCLPDPVMGPDDHYKPFSDVYGTPTTENDRPSQIQRRKTKTLTYSPSEQHVKNAGVLVQCDECDKWRLLFSKRKLSLRERTQLEQIIADVSYSCGATTEDLLFPDTLKSVGMRIHNCIDPIEKIYYSAYSDDPICIHCGTSNNLTLPVNLDTFYPFCLDCSSLDRFHKRQ